MLPKIPEENNAIPNGQYSQYYPDKCNHAFLSLDVEIAGECISILLIFIIASMYE
jgi:hypothetical protein